MRRWHYQGSPAAALLARLWPALVPHFAPHMLTGLRLSPSAYLHFEILRKEPAMVRVSLRFELRDTFRF